VDKIVDKIDKQILAILQEDASTPVAEIAEKVNLSSTPCWRRIQKLEEDGVVLRRVALLDAEKLNVGVTVFVSIKTNQHNANWYAQFSNTVKLIPEVVEFYRMSGNIDYLLRVVVPNIAAYDAVYQKLTQSNALFDVNASFAMEQIKHTTALPLDYVGLD
jgi:Lrp/AsnC family transcriptional regulator